MAEADGSNRAVTQQLRDQFPVPSYPGVSTGASGLARPGQRALCCPGNGSLLGRSPQMDLIVVIKIRGPCVPVCNISKAVRQPGQAAVSHPAAAPHQSPAATMACDSSADRPVTDPPPGRPVPARQPTMLERTNRQQPLAAYLPAGLDHILAIVLYKHARVAPAPASSVPPSAFHFWSRPKYLYG
ncbi:hypothetical protein EYF80_029055 [Liparis tanakae]|uniref:Uncharacterized protein n=1 Tax=Liparis tanakae TaxID=230148 RepID=A0A4Z2H508_9TELE|nr:hypothetical protein EYF80_029055 [Liparis tanakae]